MAIPASLAIIAASRDNDLLTRMVAIGSTMDISQADVEKNRTLLSSAPVNTSGDTVAGVYEFAAAQPRYRAGEDPTAVTDEHIAYALQQTFKKETTTE